MIGIIGITWPEPIEGESGLITNLLEAGLMAIHIRKPGRPDSEISAIIKAIPEEMHSRVIIHGSADLCKNFEPGGFHIPGIQRKEMTEQVTRALCETMAARGISVSTSIHELSELEQLGPKFKRVYIGPVFESLSKPGYAPTLRLEDVKHFLQRTVRARPMIYAIGGIQESNVKQVRDAGFDGVALLGSLWLKPEQSLKAYRKIEQKCQEPVPMF
jgi:thiamine-phosphate pyrophosphorylase